MEIILGEQLGKGSIGTVYRASYKGITFAIKKVEGLENGLNEIDSLCRIQHPCIVGPMKGVFAFNFENTNTSLLTMPIGDMDLDSYLKLRGSSLSHQDKLRMTFEIMSAISFLNSYDLFHCDLKPDNIYIFGDRIKLIDLGLVNRGGHKNVSTCHTYYFSTLEAIELYHENGAGLDPEIAAETLKNINYRRSEMWALGIIIFYIWTGHHPFEGYKSDISKVTEEDLEIFRDSLRRYKLDKWAILNELPYEAQEICSRLMEPDYNLITYSVDPLFMFLSKYGYGKPIMGSLVTKTIVSHSSNLYLLTPRVIEEIKDFMIGLNKMTVLDVSVLMCSIHLFFHVVPHFGHKNQLRDIAIACTYIASSCYATDLRLTVEEIIDTKGFVPTSDTVIPPLIINLVDYLGGILSVNPIYQGAFSQKSILQAMNGIVLNHEAYLTEDLSKYMSNLEAMETTEDRNNRISKDKFPY